MERITLTNDERSLDLNDALQQLQRGGWGLTDNYIRVLAKTACRRALQAEGDLKWSGDRLKWLNATAVAAGMPVGSPLSDLPAVVRKLRERADIHREECLRLGQQRDCALAYADNLARQLTEATAGSSAPAKTPGPHIPLPKAAAAVAETVGRCQAEEMDGLANLTDHHLRHALMHAIEFLTGSYLEGHLERLACHSMLALEEWLREPREDDGIDVELMEDVA
jgi:hypothetical protein